MLLLGHDGEVSRPGLLPGRGPLPSGLLPQIERIRRCSSQMWVATSDAVRGTASRNAKIEALADLLRRLDTGELEVAIGFLTGEPRQGKVGVGWAVLSAVDVAPAADPSLAVTALDRTIEGLAVERGPGSAARRRETLEELVGLATESEGEFIRRLLIGELRQGALEGVMVAAIALAAAVPVAAVRRALMLNGDLGRTAALALGGGEPVLAAVGLEVLRAIKPMLAASEGGRAIRSRGVRRGVRRVETRRGEDSGPPLG